MSAGPNYLGQCLPSLYACKHQPVLHNLGRGNVLSPDSSQQGRSLHEQHRLLPFMSRYEGLTRDDAPHMKGVMIFGNGHGGGMEKAKKGDK